MKVTIEIETEKLTNKVLFQVTDECTKQGVNTKDVETILVWEGMKLHKLRFQWGVEGKITGLSKKDI